MMITEMVALFLDSRKNGHTGAKKQASSKTLDIYKRNLNLFTGFLAAEIPDGGVLQYEGVRRSHVVLFTNWLDTKQTSGKWSKSTAMQMIRTLRTFFRWVEVDEDCQAEKLKGFHKYLPVMGKIPRREAPPPIKDLRMFKNNFNTNNRWGYRDYVSTCLMLDTGIRLGEVCNLRVDHTLLEQGLIIVDGKTGPRPVPFTAEMGRLLSGWLKKRAGCKSAKDSPFVFVSKYDQKMSVNGFGQRFRKHRKKFNIPKVSAHYLRHSFCTNYLQKGGDMERLRMITGHSNYEMLRQYLHLAQIGGKAAKDELEKVSLLKDM